ncbi:hypothetical protein AVEN_257770-1 [Araneus ventricosus]|uniref:Uncharacterized protein n=1 Tax=Araneus ventricosus TaxID=182803 RepID=A0A4Y2KBQ9_ARAVE|nr:hypothetical protein AVEN_257770-1 [Araneus ventricosus]
MSDLSLACALRHERKGCNCKWKKVNTVVSWFNDATLIVKNCVRTTVANKDTSFRRELLMLVGDKITDFIPNKVINVDVDVSEFVSLADHSFNVPIDMLLGAEIFMNC